MKNKHKAVHGSSLLLLPVLNAATICWFQRVHMQNYAACAYAKLQQLLRIDFGLGIQP